MAPRSLEPRDRTRREHIAKVERIIYTSDDESFSIIALADGSTACGPASPASFAPSTLYRFLGQWEDDRKYGPRFKFSAFVVHAAAGRAGVVAYLTKLCDGFAEKRCNRLWDVFGAESVQKLRTAPSEVAERCGIDLATCQEAADALERDKRFQNTKVELFSLLDKRGFRGSTIDLAIEKWGVRAPAIIQHNPFALLGMPSAGFKRCDKLWCDLGLPRHSPKRQVLCAWNLIRNDRNGHTWLAAEDLGNRLLDAIPAAEPIKAFRVGIRARKMKKHKDAAGKVWLAEYERATAEERIAAAVARLNTGECLWPTGRVPVSQVDGDRLPSEHQVERLKLAAHTPVGLFLGGPGTGKTHTLAYLLREVIAEFGASSVCVCAPTGKAAVRATQALHLSGLSSLRALTIHTTLEIEESGYGGERWAFRYNRTCPLPYRFVVVDESSMIDTDLMADLLDACGRGTQILFVGDPYQLPPVGHGAPLRDMIEGGVSHGELTEVRRNAGQIVHACARIKSGESFETAETIDLDAVPPANLKILETQSTKESADLLMKVLAAAKKFHPVWQTQVIVARNKAGDLSRKGLNDRLQTLLNPDGHTEKGNPFRIGDKIICTRNSRMNAVEPVGEFHESYREEMERQAGNYQALMEKDEDGRPTREPVQVYVANGEIGRVLAIGAGVAIARFSEGENLIKIPIGKQKHGDEEEEEGGDSESGGGGRGCNFDLAYAVTCHKMQGSEAPFVIIMADPDAGMIADRSWWYTAISRASKLCVIIGQKSWVDKQRVRQSLVRRKTFLKELIANVGFNRLEAA